MDYFVNDREKQVSICNFLLALGISGHDNFCYGPDWSVSWLFFLCILTVFYPFFSSVHYFLLFYCVCLCYFTVSCSLYVHEVIVSLLLHMVKVLPVHKCWFIIFSELSLFPGTIHWIFKLQCSYVSCLYSFYDLVKNLSICDACSTDVYLSTGNLVL